ncbi:MAG: STAS domain-containing protein [Moraxellaceae bacterium]|nr:STAS domain-containing protein [Moraxellaceae bacterium]
MTQATVGQMLYEGAGLLAQAGYTLDLSAVTAMDSTALAVLVAWMRCANASGERLRVLNLPGTLSALADLYGIDDLLNEATAPADDLTHVLDRH